MKKKIIIVTSFFSLLFLCSGIYIITAIASATSTLDNLIKLHQVEILREHLLLQIKKVQVDISLRNTRHARGNDTIVSDVMSMKQVASACRTCHHEPAVLDRLNDMRRQLDNYGVMISRLMTIKAGAQRMRTEEDNAYRIGEDLISKVNNMIALTSTKLEEKTASNLEKIKCAKISLYIIVAMGPVVGIGFAFFMTRSITKPITTLLEATRRIKDGSLDYKVAGLKHEFSEVAESFNEMAISLKEHMLKIEESEKRYRMLFESAADAIFILETEGGKAGKIIAANRAAADMHGYAADELLTLNIKDLDTPEAAKDVSKCIDAVLGGEWYKAEIDHVKKDGTVFPVEVSSGLLDLGNNKKYALVFGRDISVRKRAERM
ncbi:MAG: PAS domain S-box protein, partial [Nitrospirae bacterium]|nr:PAS domain S-box protein [Nitrospirota bacterium]